MSATKSTWKVSAAVMASRVLGLAREIMFGSLFGGNMRGWMDCFNLAFRIPNLLRDLFAEGALSQAFVTTFSKRLKSDGEQSAWSLANKTMTLAAIVLAIVTIIGVIAAPWIVDLLTIMSKSDGAKRSYNPQEIAFIVLLVRIMYPFIFVVSLAALVMGMLNAKQVFGMPALSSCFFNIGSMVFGAAFGYMLDPHWGAQSLIGFAIGVVIGGCAQLACQFPSLTKVGYRFALDFDWRDSGIKQILRLMGPAVISASIVQINVMVNSSFAYGVCEGAVSWLSYAFRLMQLPIGIFGVAIATVTLPAMSRAATNGITDEFRQTLSQGIRLAAFLVIPSTLILVFLAEPIISVMFEHGKFDQVDRISTAKALQAYGCGLVFYAWLKILQPAFYAADKRWFPMMASLVGLFLNFFCNYLFVNVWHLGHVSLALTTSITAGLTFITLYIAMNRIAGGLQSRTLIVTVTKILTAGSAIFWMCHFANKFLFNDLSHTALWLKLIELCAVCGLCGVTFFFICKLLRVKEATDAFALVMKKLGR